MNNKLLDDLTQLITSAMSAAQGVRDEAEIHVRSNLEKLLSEFEFVPRDEFEAVRLMAQKARQENDKLAMRMNELEQKVKDLSTDKL